MKAIALALVNLPILSWLKIWIVKYRHKAELNYWLHSQENILSLNRAIDEDKMIIADLEAKMARYSPSSEIYNNPGIQQAERIRFLQQRKKLLREEVSRLLGSLSYPPTFHY